MTKRRARGDGGLHWDESRQRWIASVTVGYTPDGRRIVRRASDKHKSKALAKLKEKIRDYEDGLAIAPHHYTRGRSSPELAGGSQGTARSAAASTASARSRKHVIPALGARKLRDLTADDVDQWLAREAKEVSTRTVQELRSILKRAVARAQARDKVKRNVILLCELPKGKQGRPSKAMNPDRCSHRGTPRSDVGVC